MMWFNGSIQSAINKVKSSCSFLLVFVQGDDDLSKRYEKLLNEEVKFKSGEFVPIRILHNSVAYEQFKKIYITVPVPSVFLIGTNGVPLTIFCSQDPSNLNNAIIEAIAKKKIQNGTHTGNDDERNKKTEHSNDEKLISQRVNTCDEEHNIDFSHCQFFVEDKRKMCETLRTCPLFFLCDSNSSCDRIRISQKIQSARIQFRLPSNEIRSWEFPNMCTLHDVKLYLMETVNLGQGFKLLRTFPRTAFTSEDENKTLTDLKLTPNATLIVVPLHDETVQSRIRKIVSSNNFISSVVSVIFEPVIVLFRYFSKFFQRPSQSKKLNEMKKSRSDLRQKSKKISTSNIHGFAFDESDTDSDMNTDNGNSTQQK